MWAHDARVFFFFCLHPIYLDTALMNGHFCLEFVLKMSNGRKSWQFADVADRLAFVRANFVLPPDAFKPDTANLVTTVNPVTLTPELCAYIPELLTVNEKKFKSLGMVIFQLPVITDTARIQRLSTGKNLQQPCDDYFICEAAAANRINYLEATPPHAFKVQQHASIPDTFSIAAHQCSKNEYAGDFFRRIKAEEPPSAPASTLFTALDGLKSFHLYLQAASFAASTTNLLLEICGGVAKKHLHAVYMANYDSILSLLYPIHRGSTFGFNAAKTAVMPRYSALLWTVEPYHATLLAHNVTGGDLLWVCVSQAYQHAINMLLLKYFPEEARVCPRSLHHRKCMFTNELLRRHDIPITIVSNPCQWCFFILLLTNSLCACRASAARVKWFA